MLAMAGAIFSLLGLVGGAFDERIYGDFLMRLPLFTLLTLISLVGLTLHAVAIVARGRVQKNRGLCTALPHRVANRAVRAR